MSDHQQQQEQRQSLPKRVALKEEAYYANATMVEMTPFDVAILFGKVRPVSDANGQRSLVEMYDRQIYLSHLQAGVLYEALGRSLESLSRQGRGGQGEEIMAEGVTEEGSER